MRDSGPAVARDPNRIQLYMLYDRSSRVCGPIGSGCGCESRFVARVRTLTFRLPYPYRLFQSSTYTVTVYDGPVGPFNIERYPLQHPLPPPHTISHTHTHTHIVSSLVCHCRASPKLHSVSYFSRVLFLTIQYTIHATTLKLICRIASCADSRIQSVLNDTTFRIDRYINITSNSRAFPVTIISAICMRNTQFASRKYTCAPCKQKYHSHLNFFALVYSMQ